MMDIHFEYNTAEYRRKNKQVILITRIVGIIFLLVGIATFFINNRELRFGVSLSGILYIVTGIIALFFPYKLFRNTSQTSFVTIDNDTIKWNDDPNVGLQTLRLREIKSYKRYIGQIHFTTNSGTIVKLNNYIIEDEEKQKEFLDILKTHFTSIDAAVLAQ